MKSLKAQKHFNDLLLILTAARAKRAWSEMMEGKTYPVRLQIKIYRRTHRRFDYINIVQNLLDAMVTAGWLPDDDALHVIPVFEPYEKDAANPRTEISILRDTDCAKKSLAEY